jgi:hypothetical protein
MAIKPVIFITMAMKIIKIMAIKDDEIFTRLFHRMTHEICALEAKVLPSISPRKRAATCPYLCVYDTMH